MDTNRNEIYFSCDIEADGGIPAVNSMLSFGIAAYLPDKGLVGTFERNLDALPEAVQDADTMVFWSRFPEAWEACRKDTVAPEKAMKDCTAWVKQICAENDGYPVFLAYPAGFDFTFIYWYLVKFTGSSVFSFSSLDIKSFAMAMLGSNFKETVKKYFPKRWMTKGRHKHVALSDALEQGEIFMKMLAENNDRLKAEIK